MILATSDLHSHPVWMKWLQRSAKTADAAILAGDTVDQSPEEEFAARCDQARADLVKMDVPTFICSGNHDYDPISCSPPPEWMRRAQSARRAIIIDGGHGITRQGARVLCVPDGATFLEPSLRDCGPVDILVTHAPPDKTRLAGRGGEGCPQVLEFALSRASPPRLVICGHAHDPEQRIYRVSRTTFLNLASGRRAAPYPPHAWIDWGAQKLRLVEFEKPVVDLTF